MSKKEEPIAWFSLKGGKRIPIFEGQSKADAVKSALGGKDTDKKQVDKKQVSEFGKSYESKQTGKVDKSVSRDDDKKEQSFKRVQNEAKRLNAEDKYRDTLKSSGKGKTAVSNGKLTFNGKEVPKLDTSDASPNRDDSFAQRLDKNGNITPEGLKVYQGIFDKHFNGHQPYGPDDEKVAMFTGGGGASGKGQFSGEDSKTHESNIGKFYSQNKNPIVFDPDKIKDYLYEADKDALKSAGKTKEAEELTYNAGYYHEESSALAKQLYSTALQNNYPVLYDGTATKPKSAIKKAVEAEQAGYKTEMCFLRSDPKTIRENSLRRYEFGKQHRLVPPKNLLGAHQDAYDAVVELQDKFDSFKLYDNSGNSLKFVGGSTGKTKLKIENQESWKSFSNARDDFTWSPAELDSYMRDAEVIKERLRKQGIKV